MNYFDYFILLFKTINVISSSFQTFSTYAITQSLKFSRFLCYFYTTLKIIYLCLSALATCLMFLDENSIKFVKVFFNRVFYSLNRTSNLITALGIYLVYFYLLFPEIIEYIAKSKRKKLKFLIFMSCLGHSIYLISSVYEKSLYFRLFQFNNTEYYYIIEGIHIISSFFQYYSLGFILVLLAKDETPDELTLEGESTLKNDLI